MRPRSVFSPLTPARWRPRSHSSPPLPAFIPQLADFGLSKILKDTDDHAVINHSGAGEARLPGAAAAGAGNGADHCPAVSRQEHHRRRVGAPAPADRLPLFLRAHAPGTVTHLAPEMLVRGTHITTAVDVFAFGILMWEFYTGLKPWAGAAKRDGGAPRGPRAMTGGAPAGPRPIRPSWTACAARAGHSQGPNPRPAPPPPQPPPGLPQDAIIHRVLHTGARPPFPAGAPPAYAGLAAACWAHDPAARPRMGDVIAALQAVARGLDGLAAR
jgi:hypothetical protein